MQQVISRFQQINSRPEAKNEIEQLAQILERTHSDSPLPYRIYADLYFQTEHYNEARNKYEQSLLIDENAREVFAQLMDIDLRLKDNEALEKHSRRATELFPQLPGFFYFNDIKPPSLDPILFSIGLPVH